jgi:hypothetical protein
MCTALLNSDTLARKFCVLPKVLTYVQKPYFCFIYLLIRLQKYAQNLNAVSGKKHKALNIFESTYETLMDSQF